MQLVTSMANFTVLVCVHATAIRFRWHMHMSVTYFVLQGLSTTFVAYFGVNVQSCMCACDLLMSFSMGVLCTNLAHCIHLQYHVSNLHRRLKAAFVLWSATSFHPMAQGRLRCNLFRFRFHWQLLTWFSVRCAWVSDEGIATSQYWCLVRILSFGL